MGAPRDLRFPTETVRTSGGDLEVHGLETAAITSIIKDHGELIDDLLSKADTDTDVQLNTASLLGFVSEQTPQLLGKIAAYGARAYDDESVEICRRMPFPDQFKVVEAVFRLTFVGEDAVKNFVEIVINTLNSFSETMTVLGSPSENGSGNSEAA